MLGLRLKGNGRVIRIVLRWHHLREHNLRAKKIKRNFFRKEQNLFRARCMHNSREARLRPRDESFQSGKLHTLSPKQLAFCPGNWNRVVYRNFCTRILGIESCRRVGSGKIREIVSNTPLDTESHTFIRKRTCVRRILLCTHTRRCAAFAV